MAARAGRGASRPADNQRPPLPATSVELRELFDALPDPVAVVGAVRDSDGVVVDFESRYVNEAALRLYGKTAEEVIGRPVTDVFPAVRESDRWPVYLRVFETGGSETLDVLWTDESGVEAGYEVLVSRFQDGVMYTVHHATDRMRAQQQLSHELDLNKAMLDVAGALIAVVDAEFRFVRFNRECERLTGYLQAEILGRHFSILLPPAERDRVVAVVLNSPADRPSDVESYYVTKAGDLRRVRASFVGLFDAAGNRTHSVVVGLDVTEERRTEDELARRQAALEQANRELARSNADLEQFAFMISHDLAEPLRAISRPIARVAERYRSTLDAESLQYLEFAQDGCTRMQQMVSALLAFSRVGRVAVKTHPVETRQVVDAAVANLRAVLESSHAVVTVQEPLPVVAAQPDQLVMVFQNLIGNAVKFVPPGEAPKVTVYAERAGEAWRFNVVDNGVGVDPKQRERIFGLFKRLHPQGQYGGTGIGLALTKKVVERHGGEIGVESAPTGTGSRFWFTLPAAAADRPAGG